MLHFYSTRSNPFWLLLLLLTETWVFLESSLSFLLKVKDLQGTWGKPRLSARSNTASWDNPASLPLVSLIFLRADDGRGGSLILRSVPCSCSSQFTSSAFCHFKTRTKTGQKAREMAFSLFLFKENERRNSLTRIKLFKQAEQPEMIKTQEERQQQLSN